MSKPFKVWDALRKEKKIIICEPEIKKIIDGAHRKGLTGSKIVLECDGCEIDEDELLTHFYGEVLMILADDQNWQPLSSNNSSSFDNSVNNTNNTSFVMIDDPIASTSHDFMNDLIVMNVPREAASSKVNDCDFQIRDISPKTGSQVSETDSYSRASLATTMTMTSGALSSDNENAIGRLQMSSLFNDFVIPWEKFPQSIMDLCNAGQKLGSHLKTVVHIIVDELRCKSNYIILDVFRNVVKKLCERFPKTFAYYDNEGKIIATRNSPLITTFVHRNNYMNRLPHRTTVSANIPLKKRRMSKKFEKSCINWQPDNFEEGENSKTVNIRRNILKELNVNKTFSKEQYEGIKTLILLPSTKKIFK